MSLRSRLDALERAASRQTIVPRCPTCGGPATEGGGQTILVGRDPEPLRCDTCDGWLDENGRAVPPPVYLVPTPEQTPELPQGVLDAEELDAAAERARLDRTASKSE